MSFTNEEIQQIITVVALVISAFLLLAILSSREFFADEKRDCSECAAAIVAKGRCGYLNMGGQACEVKNVQPVLESSAFWPRRCQGWNLPCLTEEEKQKKKEEAQKLIDEAKNKTSTTSTATTGELQASPAAPMFSRSTIATTGGMGGGPTNLGSSTTGGMMGTATNSTAGLFGSSTGTTAKKECFSMCGL